MSMNELYQKAMAKSRIDQPNLDKLVIKTQSRPMDVDIEKRGNDPMNIKDIKGAGACLWPNEVGRYVHIEVDECSTCVTRDLPTR